MPSHQWSRIEGRDRKKLLADPERLLAYRILLRCGQWDVDQFFATIPASKWEELKIAHEIIESRDAWFASGCKEKWEPPQFGPVNKPKRRRLDGTPL